MGFSGLFVGRLCPNGQGLTGQWLVKQFPAFYETLSLIPFSQQPIIRPFSEPQESNPRPPTLFFKKININLSSMLGLRDFHFFQKLC
jgi:hypothetical protein